MQFTTIIFDDKLSSELSEALLERFQYFLKQGKKWMEARFFSDAEQEEDAPAPIAAKSRWKNIPPVFVLDVLKEYGTHQLETCL